VYNPEHRTTVERGEGSVNTHSSPWYIRFCLGVNVSGLGSGVVGVIGSDTWRVSGYTPAEDTSMNLEDEVDNAVEVAVG
jgi:hypothetical protein